MFGIVIVAGYLLWAMQRSLFGPFRLETDYEITPASVHDVVPIVTLVLLVILLGTVPELFFEMIRDATIDVIEVGGGFR
jgi:NADH-quinone oxidoreductase subunit M